MAGRGSLTKKEPRQRENAPGQAKTRGSRRMVKLAVIFTVLVSLAGCGGTGTGDGSHVASASAKPVSAAEALRETQGAHPSQRELAEATREEKANATSSVVATSSPIDENADKARFERWQRLQHDLVSALVLQGGASAYIRLAEESRVPADRPEVRSELRTLIQSLSTTSANLLSIARESDALCAARIENARSLLARRRLVVEQTRSESMGSEYEWANSAHELEGLVSPPEHLGEGLQHCDPKETGRIEVEGEAPRQAP
jgi:hypothetical protein